MILLKVRRTCSEPEPYTAKGKEMKLTATLFALALCACGGTNSGATPSYIIMQTESSSVVQGGLDHVMVTEVFSDSSENDVTAQAAYTLSVPTDAAWDQAELAVRGLQPGELIITAKVDGLVTQQPLQVTR